MFMDSMLAFQLDKKNVRGRLARVGPMLEDILKNHNYPNRIALLLAEVTLLTALIGEMIKLRWRLSLQIRGEGPVKLLATDYFAPNKKKGVARLRAYADYDKTRDFSGQKISSDLIGKGFFSLIIDQGRNMEPYKGITPIVKGDLARSAETYFFQSEQILTLFSLNITKNHQINKEPYWNAVGLMVQELPNVKEKKQTLERKNWKYFSNRITEKVQIYSNHEKIDEYQFLNDVFNSLDITVYAPKKIKFGCSCRKDKVLSTLKGHSRKELEAMQDSTGIIQADCQFCGKIYRLKIDR